MEQIYSPNLSLFMMSNLHTILFPCVSLFSSYNDTISLFTTAIMSKNLTVVLSDATDQKCSLGQNCCPNAFIFMDNLPKKLPYHWRRIVVITKTNLPKAEIFGWKDVFIITNTTIFKLSTHVDQIRHFSIFEQQEELKKEKIDLMGRKLKVSAFDCLPLVKLSQFGATGYDIKILEEMSKKFNFTWEIKILTDWNKYGTIVDDRWVGGVKGNLADNLVDIGICGNWIFGKSLAAIDITIGTIESQVRLFVPKAKRVEKWYSLITPFAPSLWIAIFLTILVMTIIYKYFLSINGISIDLCRAFFEMYSIFFGNYLTRSKLKNVALITFTFSIFTILITNIYSSEIISRLANAVYNKEIDSVEDLVRSGIFWGRMNKTDTEIEIILNFEKKSHRDIVHKLKLFESKSDCLGQIRSNRFALYADIFGINGLTYPITDCGTPNELWGNLRLMKEALKIYYCGIGFQKYSPLTQQTSRLIRRLQGGGLLGKMYTDTIIKFGKKKRSDKHRREIIEPKPLSLNNMQGAFYSLLIGLLTSLIVFIIELISITLKCLF